MLLGQVLCFPRSAFAGWPRESSRNSSRRKHRGKCLAVMSLCQSYCFGPRPFGLFCRAVSGVR